MTALLVVRGTSFLPSTAACIAYNRGSPSCRRWGPWACPSCAFPTAKDARQLCGSRSPSHPSSTMSVANRKSLSILRLRGPSTPTDTRCVWRLLRNGASLTKVTTSQHRCCLGIVMILCLLDRKRAYPISGLSLTTSFPLQRLLVDAPLFNFCAWDRFGNSILSAIPDGVELFLKAEVDAEAFRGDGVVWRSPKDGKWSERVGPCLTLLKCSLDRLSGSFRVPLPLALTPEVGRREGWAVAGIRISITSPRGRSPHSSSESVAEAPTK